MTSPLSVAAVSALGLAASALDVTTRRVPNALTIGAAAAGLAAQAIAGGAAGLGMAAAGCATGLALLLPWFALGGMGGGDVKLLAAFGAWLGPAGTTWAAFYAALLGGVLALVVAARHGYLRRAFGNLGAMLLQWRLTGVRPIPRLTLADADAPRLAYALPLTIGAVIVAWLG